MNLIYGETGGRPRSIDDLYLMQAEAFKAISGPFQHLENQKGGFIVYGCAPDGIQKTIGAGMIFLGGEFLEFDGATNVTFPAKFGVVETLNTMLQYEDGNSKNTRRLRMASIDQTIADFTHSFTITAGSYQELNDLFVHSFGDQGVYGTKTFKDALIAKTLNVYDTLVSLRADLTSAVATLNQTITNQVATLNQTITSAVATLNQSITTLRIDMLTALAGKADKQQLTWIDVQPASGWMCYPTEQLQVAKDQFGMVFVRGSISAVGAVSTSSAILGTIATLPSGYRPPRTFQYAVWQSGEMFGAININSDGSIEGYNPKLYPYPRFVVDHKIFSLN